MVDEQRKPAEKSVSPPSPLSGVGIPYPGPGRPKGSKDSLTAPRTLRNRWLRDYGEWCRHMEKDGYCNPLIWAYETAKKDPELLRTLVRFVFQQRLPSAVDPDRADLEIRVAELHADAAVGQEGGGRQQVNLILGDLGRYAPGITAPAQVDALAGQAPPGEAVDAEAGPAPALGMAPVPTDKEEDGPWEE